MSASQSDVQDSTYGLRDLHDAQQEALLNQALAPLRLRSGRTPKDGNCAMLAGAPCAFKFRLSPLRACDLVRAALRPEWALESARLGDSLLPLTDKDKPRLRGGMEWRTLAPPRGELCGRVVQDLPLQRIRGS